jgi:hypothetical protein
VIPRRTALRAGLAIFAALDLMVIVAPSAVIALAARQGGLPGVHGLDLVIASTVLGAAHAWFVSARLRRELRHGARVNDEIIATFNSLVVLALGATGLFILILGGFAPEHAALINRGWPTLGLWIGVTLAAVLLAEITRSRILRWLEPPQAMHRETEQETEQEARTGA